MALAADRSALVGKEFSRRFRADDEVTRLVLAALLAEFADAGIGADDCANAELILAEVLNNVAEHAYAGLGGPVELNVRIDADGLDCLVIDRGCGMPTGDAPNPGAPVLDAANLPEGGFGWHIIRCLTSDLRYRRDGNRNRLMMVIPWVEAG